MSRDRRNKLSVWGLTVLAVIISCGLLAGGAWWYLDEARSIREAKSRELSAVATLKAEQVAAWRRERLDDVSVAVSGVLRKSVMLWLREDGQGAWEKDIRQTLALLGRHYGYRNVILTRPDGTLLTALEPLRDCAHAQHLAARTVRSGEASIGDFFLCEACGFVHLDAAGALLDDEGKPMAVLLLRSHPEDYLFPLVERQPSSDLAMESILVRKEKGQTVVLNRLRRHPDPALSALVLPRADKDVETAAREGTIGFIEGVDGRGIKVLSSIQAVPDSPWFVVITVDENEVLAPARRRGGLIALLTSALILATVTGMGFLHKRAGKRMYRALYLSERRERETIEEHRITLASIGDGVISTDAEGRVSYMNAVAEHLTGWPQSEARGKPMTEVFRIINEQTRATVENPVGRVLREGRIVGLANHTLLVDRTGKERPIMDSAAPIRTELGDLCGVVLVFRDQTREREAQAALLNERRNIEAMLNAVPVAILLLDDSETVVRVNAAAERLFGRPLADMRRRRCGDFIGCVQRYTHPDGCGHTEECPQCALFIALRRVLSGGDAVRNGEMEVRLETAAGKRRASLLYSVEPVYLDERRHAIAALYDVSEQRHIEEQLRQAQKMEAVGRLAGGVAHDFNNMLGVIMGHAELVVDQPELSATVRRDIREIQKAAERSANLTRQLLAYARRQTVAPVPLDLNETIENILKMLRRLIGENIELVWLPGHNLGVVEMDPSQVDQLLTNLLVNARDAIDGAGKVRIETRRANAEDLDLEPGLGNDADAYVVLSVSDTGGGIEPAVLDHIFEPFFTTKGVGEGTGLGLAMVHGIVGQNKGIIRVQSTPGEGTQFILFLPRLESCRQLPGGSGEPPPAHGHETILLVEDEEAILQLGRRTLERFGYKVLTAGTPEEALDMVRAGNDEIHLLLTDLVMPGMNGRELSRQVKVFVPTVRVLFMSGYTDNVIVHNGILESGLSFLQKPFSGKVLAQRVRAALDA